MGAASVHEEKRSARQACGVTPGGVLRGGRKIDEIAASSSRRGGEKRGLVFGYKIAYNGYIGGVNGYMSDNRKNVKVIPGVKYELGVLKKRLGLKTESEVILYLQEFYGEQKDKQTLSSHNKLKESVNQLHRQITL